MQAKFQSAPLTKARGDWVLAVLAVGFLGLFQSAPLTKARGDTNKPDGVVSVANVSIRSPHKSKGRLVSPSAAAALSLFQSAPLTKARGDQQGGGSVI